MSYQNSVAQVLQLIKINQEVELENVKLELAEIKDKYAKLSADLADMKEVL